MAYVDVATRDGQREVGAALDLAEFSGDPKNGLVRHGGAQWVAAARARVLRASGVGLRVGG